MALKPLNDALAESHDAMREQLAAVAVAAAKSASHRLNQISRCMRQAANLEQWLDALMDGTAGFCARAALFAVEGKLLVCRATRGLPRIEGSVPMEAAPALASAVESQDTVAAVRTAGEMSKVIAEAFAAGGTGKAYLIPLIGRKRSLAVLYAEETTDLDALELLMTIAASAREHFQANTPLVEIARADASAGEMRTRRFAQARVAEIRLAQTDAVDAGRSQGNLYSRLQSQIDAARESYRKEFASGDIPDYLHLEIVKTLANNDATTLGSDYPGSLV